MGKAIEPGDIASMGSMLTVSQFARLHDVNTRTLHYYDEVGLFSPRSRGGNGYRYYDASQSLEFEYIRMLRDLGFGVEEIKDYVSHSGERRFVAVLTRLRAEVRERKERLERLEKVLDRKAGYLADCESVSQDRVEVVHRPETQVLTMTSVHDGEDTLEFMQLVKRRWGLDRLRSGIGSFIAVRNVRSGRFDRYDGVFVADGGTGHAAEPGRAQTDDRSAMTLPSGEYLCGYHRGVWSGLPDLYRSMLRYADGHGLELGDYAYERGLNEFAISSPQDYVTRILIPLRS